MKMGMNSKEFEEELETTGLDNLALQAQAVTTTQLEQTR